MAAAVCGCRVVRAEDDAWIVADVASGCPFVHVVGQRGRVEGEPARVSGVGECVTIVFDRVSARPSSRTAMLTTPSESSRVGG